jgi:trimeric autotransporter adhesin
MFSMTTREKAAENRVRVMVVIAGLALMGGCDQRTVTQQNVEEGTRELVAMTGGRSNPAPEATRDKTYKAVLGKSQPASGASDGEKSAASLLASISHDGMGDSAAGAVASLEGKVRYEIVVIQSELGRWASASATAQAAEALDVSRELADIAASKADKDTQMQAESARRTAIEQELRGLREQSAAKLAAAEAKLAEYRALSEQAMRMSPGEGTPVVERAAEIRHAGEALRLEGLKLAARADSVEPRLTEVTAIISKLSKQKEDLARIEASVQARAAAAREEAAAARRAASEAAGTLAFRLTALENMRKGELSKAYDAAFSAYAAATSAAKAAAAGAKSPGSTRLALGSAHLSTAEMHWSRARGEQAYGALLATLVGSRPALPNQSELQGRLTTAQSEHKSAIAAAQKSLEDAKAAFDGANVGGGAKERLESLGALLEKAIETVKDERLDAAGKFGFRTRMPESLPAGMGASPGASASPPAAGSGDEVAQVRAELEKLFAGQIENQKKLVKLNEICKAKYGKSFAQVLASNPMLGGNAEMIERSLAMTPADFQITIVDDETATATAPGMPMPVTFRKVDGAWQVPGGGTSAAPMQRAAAAMMASFEAWGGDIEAGKFADEAAASDNLMVRLQAVMMQMMGGDGK